MTQLFTHPWALAMLAVVALLAGTITYVGQDTEPSGTRQPREGETDVETEQA